MDKKTAGAILAILIILIGGLRLTFALDTPLLNYDGYNQLRLVTHIAETGLPLYDDPLSYLGRERAYSPLYHYILAPFTLGFDPVIILKTLPNIIYLATILLVYLIGHEISNNRAASIIAAALAGFTPITFAQYLNNASPYTLALPLLLLTLYALLRPKERLTLLVTSSILLSILSPIVFLLIGGLALFLLIAAVEKLTIDSAYAETLFFLLFFGLWTTLILYKDAFLEQGFNTVWAYIPDSLLANYFSEFTIITAVAIIGVLPLAFGGYTAYHALFNHRAHRTLLIVSVSFAALAALLLRVIPLRTGMIILTFMLCILAAQGIAHLMRFFKKTRAPQLRYAAVGVLLFFFVFASVFPALSAAAETMRDTPTEDHVAAAAWLAQRDSTIVAAPHEGFYFQYAAHTPTLTDEVFLLVENANVAYEDTATIYRAPFVLPALERLDYYGITHIIFSDEARETYARQTLQYLPNHCFSPVFYSTTITIYEVRCDVTTN